MSNNEEYFINLNKDNLKNALKKADFGTVIIANRYNEVDKVNDIPMGHRVGPYIVIYNDSEKLYCIKGRSTSPQERFSIYATFYLNKDNYKLNKKTNFDIKEIRVINYNEVLNIVDKLKLIDYKTLKKRMTIMKNRGYYKEFPFIDYKVPYEIGDIVIDDEKRYLIINIKEEEYTLVPIYVCDNIEDENHLFVDKIHYTFDYDNIKVVNNKPGKIITCLTHNQLSYISTKLKTYFDNLTQKAKKIGSIVMKNNKLYYIFGEDKNLWISYEISTNSFNNTVPITINNKIYYTDFKRFVRFDKNDNFYDCIDYATDDERQTISKTKKEYNREIKINNTKQQQKKKTMCLKIGDIVKTKTMDQSYYIVVNPLDKGAYCVNFDEIKNNKYRPQYLDYKLLIKKGIIPSYCFSIENNKVEFNDNIKKLVLRN